MGAQEEREVSRQLAAQYEALAHMVRRHQSPPNPGAEVRHHLPAGDGVREARVGAPG